MIAQCIPALLLSGDSDTRAAPNQTLKLLIRFRLALSWVQRSGAVPRSPWSNAAHSRLPTLIPDLSCQCCHFFKGSPFLLIQVRRTGSRRCCKEEKWGPSFASNLASLKNTPLSKEPFPTYHCPPGKEHSWTHKRDRAQYNHFVIFSESPDSYWHASICKQPLGNTLCTSLAQKQVGQPRQVPAENQCVCSLISTSAKPHTWC